MMNVRGFCIACIVLPIFLLSCGPRNLTQMVSRRLDPANLNTKLGTQITDLSVDGKCPGTKALRVINEETRTDNYCINDAMGCRWYIIPKDFADYVVKHIESKLIESNIKVSEGLGNEIMVSLEEIKAVEGVWSFGSFSKITIRIPEINYSKTYVGESGSGLGDYAVAFAIHLSIDNFIKDPVFQNFVRCHQESGSHKP